MSSAAPYFSVIIPTYNREKVIAEAVQSVLDQTFTDFEVIVIDDGSKDNSGEIVKELAKTDQRLRYIYQDNAERSRARNHGIRESKGEYICFLDSDDLFEKEHLAAFHDYITKNDRPVALLYGNSVGRRDAERWVSELPEINSENLIEVLMEHSIPSQQVCIHSSILQKHQFNPEIRIGEDRELWFRISEDFPVIHTGQSTVVIRDLGDRSIDTTNIWAYHENIEHIKHLQSIDTKGRIPNSIIGSMLSTGYFKLALCYFNGGKRLQALRYLLVSILRWPFHKYKYKIIFLMNILGLQFLLPAHIRNEY